MTDEEILAFLCLLGQYARSKDMHLGLPTGWGIETDFYMVAMTRRELRIPTPTKGQP